MQISTTVMEGSMEIPQKAKDRLSISHIIGITGEKT
jgi:hypothetical protein